MKFKKKPIVVDAEQWLTLDDNIKEVKPFSHPGDCQSCGEPYDLHGLIMTPEDGLIVCSGDWIGTGHDVNMALKGDWGFGGGDTYSDSDPNGYGLGFGIGEGCGSRNGFGLGAGEDNDDENGL